MGAELKVRVAPSPAGYLVAVGEAVYDCATAEATAERILACCRASRAMATAEAQMPIPRRVVSYLRRAGQASLNTIAAALCLSTQKVGDALEHLVATGAVMPLSGHEPTMYRATAKAH